MKNRKKKIVAVVIAVCVIAGLAVFIHKPNVVVETTQTPEVVTTAEITVAEIKIAPPKTTPTETAAEEESSEPTDETETDNAPDAEQGEEIVQDFTEATKPEPPKPPVVPIEIATDPVTPPTYTPEQTVCEVTTTAPKIEIPQGGVKKNGQIYIPGFGWIKDEGGGGKSTPATGMKENGNKIGTFG